MGFEKFTRENRRSKMKERKTITVVFEEAGDMDGWWVVTSPDLPSVITQGNGFVDAIDMFKDAYQMMHEYEESNRTDK